MDKDTDIGGSRGGFPDTHRSAVLAARSDDPEVRGRAFDTLVRGYWKPIYKYIRFKWNADNEEAKDLTQGFFAQAMEKGYFDRYQSDLGTFRTFLRTCLDRYVANEKAAAGRIKRGGDIVVLSLDFDAAEAELSRHAPPADRSPDEYFDREWIRNVFSLAVDSVRETFQSNGKAVHFELFERYDLSDADAEQRPTYDRLAEEFGLKYTQVTNYLAAARRAFRRSVLEHLRDMTGGDADYRREARLLLGDDAL